MVFTTIVNFARSRGPDKLWRVNKILQYAAHYFGRHRNCPSLTIRNIHRSFAYATKARKKKHSDLKELHEVRITAACSQFGIPYYAFRAGLARNNIQLQTHVLADLAIHEPKSFESLTMIARERSIQDGIRGVEERQHNNRVYYYNDEQALEKEKYDGKTAANYSVKKKIINKKRS